MKRIVFLGLVAQLSFALKAQKAKLKEIVGTPYEIKNLKDTRRLDYKKAINYNGENYVIAVRDESDFFFFSRISHQTGVVLFKLDNKNNVKQTIDIDMSPENTLGSFETCVRLGEYLFCFFTMKNEKGRKKYLFCNRYSFVSKTQKIYKVGECSTKAGSGFNIIVNPEQTRMAIMTGGVFYTGKRKKKELNGEYDFIVLNSELETLNYGLKVQLDGDKDETLVGYTITPGDGLLAITNKSVEVQTAKGKTPGIFSKERQKSAYQYFIYLLKDGRQTRIALDEEHYLRGFYGLAVNDSVYHIFSYYTKDGTGTTGIVKKTLNLQTLKIENSQFSAFSQSGSETLEDVEDSKEEKQRKNNKKNRKHDKAITQNTFANLDRINKVSLLDNGTFVVFGEGFYWYRETTRTSDGRGGTSTTTNYYYVYGPGGLVWIDSAGNILNKAIVDYQVSYSNYNPGYCGVASAIPDNGFIVGNSLGYALVDFTKTIYRIKEFKIDEGKRRWQRYGSMVIPSEAGFMMVNVKDKTLIVTTLGTVGKS